MGRSGKGTSLVGVSVAAIPGAITLALGILYGAGAVSVAGQLQDAEVPISDYLPLFPLEQMLGRGIAAMLLPVILALGMLGMAYVGTRTFVVADSDASADDEPKRSRLRVWGRRGYLALVLLVFVLLPPLEIVLVLAASLFAAALVILVTRELIFKAVPQWPLVFAWTVFITVAAVFSVFFEAYFAPQPLSYAEVTLVDGDSAEGKLVLKTGDAIYVQLSEDDAVAAIQSSEAETTTISDVERDQNASIGNRLVDLLD